MKIISQSFQMKGDLDDDYILYENGEILHKYDRSIYPGGYNLSEKLTVAQISETVKRRLLDAALDENKELVRKILRL